MNTDPNNNNNNKQQKNVEQRPLLTATIVELFFFIMKISKFQTFTNFKFWNSKLKFLFFSWFQSFLAMKRAQKSRNLSFGLSKINSLALFWFFCLQTSLSLLFIFDTTFSITILPVILSFQNQFCRFVSSSRFKHLGVFFLAYFWHSHFKPKPVFVILKMFQIKTKQKPKKKKNRNLINFVERRLAESFDSEIKVLI